MPRRRTKSLTNGTGTMERRRPRRRTFPSDGVRLYTTFLALCGLSCELSLFSSPPPAAPCLTYLHPPRQPRFSLEKLLLLLSFNTHKNQPVSPEPGRVCSVH